VQVLLEGVDLTAEGIAPHRDVQSPEGLLVSSPIGDPVGEHDHPGAGAVYRQPRGDARPQGLVQIERAHQLVHRRGLPTGDDEAVDPLQLTGAAHRDAHRTRTLHGIQVLPDIALDGEDADSWSDHGCRLCRSAPGGRTGAIGSGHG
jgi:hypothetical protein